MRKKTQQITALAFGIVFIGILLAATIIFPKRTPFQHAALRLGLALAAATVTTLFPSFFNVRIPTLVRAIGAGAICTAVYLLSALAIGTTSFSFAVIPVVGGSQAKGRASAGELVTIRQASPETLRAINQRRSAAEIRGELDKDRTQDPLRMENDRRAKTVLRVELALQATGAAKAGDDGVRIDLVKGKTVVGSGLAFTGARFDKHSPQSASVMIIPPAIFENDWTLKIRPRDTADLKLRIDQVKGHFANGTISVLHGPSADIRWQSGQQEDAVLPLRRS